MKVLLVDDDEVDRELVVRTLARSTLNAEIFEALTVDEGLDLYSQHNFDVILLDFNMPRRDGIEMIVEIRNEPKDSSTAIVMMSTSEDEELALRCIKAGAQDYLIKSEISGPRLKRAILHATARFELERQLFQSYQRVKTLAETDPLTTLPNRYFFDESLKQAITNNQRSQHKLALLLLDLDNFKIVNDTFGKRSVSPSYDKATADKYHTSTYSVPKEVDFTQLTWFPISPLHQKVMTSHLLILHLLNHEILGAFLVSLTKDQPQAHVESHTTHF